jgi:signal peptidase
MIKKILKILLGIILAVMISIGLLTIMTILPIPGNFKILTVQSGSMEPALSVGSVILIKPVTEYKIGDVVTKKTDEPGVTITHRIISKDNSSGIPLFETKGDANNIADPEMIPKEMIVGKMLGNVPKLGYLIGFAKTGKGLLVVVFLPAVLIILDEVLKIQKELAKKKDYEGRVAKRKANTTDHEEEDI